MKTITGGTGWGRASMLWMLCSLIAAVPAAANDGAQSAASAPSQPADLPQPHPLEPLLAMAEQAAERIADHVQDYTCTLVKRERVEGRLLPAETIFAKVRHVPAAGDERGGCQLYLRFESPRGLRGREILFPAPDADGHLLVRNGGPRLAFITLKLEPTCALAMRGNRYPISEFGIQRLVERMLMLGRQELAYGECLVSNQEDVQLEGRRCRVIEVQHPQRRPHFVYHIARITIDEELQLPIRFEAYDWPEDDQQPPPLIEEYTYRDLRLNVGLSDHDFSREHSDYQFRR